MSTVSHEEGAFLTIKNLIPLHASQLAVNGFAAAFFGGRCFGSAGARRLADVCLAMGLPGSVGLIPEFAVLDVGEVAWNELYGPLLVVRPAWWRMYASTVAAAMFVAALPSIISAGMGLCAYGGPGEGVGVGADSGGGGGVGDSSDCRVSVADSWSKSVGSKKSPLAWVHASVWMSIGVSVQSVQMSAEASARSRVGTSVWVAV